VGFVFRDKLVWNIGIGMVRDNALDLFSKRVRLCQTVFLRFNRVVRCRQLIVWGFSALHLFDRQ
jgi:hypothetical protein